MFDARTGYLSAKVPQSCFSVVKPCACMVNSGGQFNHGHLTEFTLNGRRTGILSTNESVDLLGFLTELWQLLNKSG